MLTIMTRIRQPRLGESKRSEGLRRARRQGPRAAPPPGPRRRGEGPRPSGPGRLGSGASEAAPAARSAARSHLSLCVQRFSHGLSNVFESRGFHVLRSVHMRPKTGPGRLRRRITAVLSDEEWEQWLKLTAELGLVRERRVGRLIAEHLSRL